MRILIFILALSARADDARLANPIVQECVTEAESLLRSEDFKEHRVDVIGACRDVDAKCVRVAGGSIMSEEHAQAALFIPVIRACRGRGVGDCLEELFKQKASFERRTTKQVLQLLKTCN